MKFIRVVIQPHKLIDVKESLKQAGITKMTVINALGCGQQQGYSKDYRGTTTDVNLLKKTIIEIAVNDEFVDSTIKAISDGAHSGNIGDGKIFVTELSRVVRIRTGEDGPEAIG